MVIEACSKEIDIHGSKKLKTLQLCYGAAVECKVLT